MTPSLKRLRELAQAATAGKWEDDGRDGIGVEVPAPEYHRIVVGIETTGSPYMQREELVLKAEDRALIVAAVNALPGLLDEVERLSATVDRKDEQMGELQEEIVRLTKAGQDTYDALEDMVSQWGGRETCLSASEDAADVLDEHRSTFAPDRAAIGAKP